MLQVMLAPLERGRWPAFALAASLAMLATAHAFEILGHLAPCVLCYNQRQIYWAASGIALIGVLGAWRGAPPRMQLAIDLLLAITFLAGAGVAAYHAGVEWKVFPAPPCAASSAGTGGDLWEKLGKPLAVPSCDDARWRMLGLSMAGWNMLVSLGLTAASVFAAFRPGAARVDTNNEPGA